VVLNKKQPSKTKENERSNNNQRMVYQETSKAVLFHRQHPDAHDFKIPLDNQKNKNNYSNNTSIKHEKDFINGSNRLKHRHVSRCTI